MLRSFRIVTALLPCIVLSACTTTLYGYRSSAGGSTTTVASTRVAASTSRSNAGVSFVSGQRVPSNTPGGQLTWSSNAGGALGVTVLVGALAGYIVGEEGPKPLPAGTKLLHTCSCYGYSPPVNGE